MKVAIQTNVWASSWHENDLAGLLGQAKAAGYDGIEIGMQRVDLSRPQRFNQLLTDAGLSLAALHTHLRWNDPAWQEDALDTMKAAADFAAATGAAYMPISGARGDKSQADLEAIVSLLDSFGNLAAANGVRFCYHHHEWELADEWREIRYLMEMTDPAKVGLLLDVGWVVFAEQSVKRFVRLFNERLCYVHAKDLRPDKSWTELGQGIVDFGDLFDRLPPHAQEWLVVERDEALPDALASSRLSRDYLREQHQI